MSERLQPSPSQLPRDEFIARFGGIYEHSPWVAAEAWDDGLGAEHDHPTTLAAMMASIVDAADDDTKLALLIAHPDLAGRAAVAGELTEESTDEQASAGIDQCSPEEFEQFQAYNSRYRARFGFPFIMAVRGANRAQILAAFADRISHDRATEFETALTQVHKIARLRLVAMATE